ncbi:MAG: hypothetical protein Q4F57_09310, partial [Weeksellaceae bacterium]|nr:hypothetical protein [Weeksellaceae bacterium]
MISVRISVFCLLNFLFLFPTKTFAQNQDEFVNQFMNEYFPKQYTSSPTASNLLEFYEYPLNNYTGLPSISFPIFSTTAKYNLGVRLSLDYHPNAVKHDNVAGYTGLGWTLVGAGGISRTVRDIPDNYFQNHKRLRDDFYKKVGIHHTENIYYQIFQSIQALFPFAGLPNTSIVDTDIYNQFLFETLAKKKFDSQEDYYHYNFFGYSGKFLLRKAGSNYSVVKLSNDNLKISYNSTLDSFEIQDTSGFVYSFVEKEYSHTSLLTQGTWWDVNPERLDYTQVLEIPFVSNYQITEVKQGMQTLVSFQYSTNQEGYNEGTTSANLTLNESVKRIPEIYSIFEDNSAPQMKFSFLPIQSLQMTITTIQSKVLKQINIHNKARIIFDIKKNARNDKKLSHKINAPYLNQIEVHDWNNSLVKKINFSYDFADRMFLNQIVEVATNQEVQKTQFQYFLKDQEAPTAKDLWGYSATPSIFCDYHEKVDKKLMKKDVLMQIIYPTGGSVYFEYEPNTFSHIQTQDLEDRYLYPDLPAYIENKDNYILEDFQNFVFSISPTPLQMLPVVEQQNLQYFSQDKDFYVVKNTSDIDQGWLFIEKYATNGSYIGIVGVQANVNCPQKVRLEGGFNYKVKFVWNLSTPGNGSISFTEIIPTSNQKKFLYGGGFRVKNIYYLEKPVNGVEEIQSNTINLSNLYENQLIKKTSFDYNFFSDNSKSSGALVSNYPVNINNHWKRVRYDGIWPSMPDFLIEDNFALEYNTHSEIDMQQTNLSQGSHVGYKQVTKVDSNPNVLTPLLDNSTPFGKMRFEYLSPIDTVQLIQNYRYQSSGYPFVSSPNADYKFGKPVYEQWIDSQSNLVQEKQYHYSFENRAEFSGFTPYYSNTQKTGADCPWVGYFQNYIQFKNYLAISVPPEQIVYWIPDSFPTLNDNNIVYPQGYPPTLLNLYNCGINNNIGEIGAFKPNIESYGWSRL